MKDNRFRVALSASFKKPNGTMTYPSFDLSLLKNDKGIDLVFLNHNDPIKAIELENIDALILLSERFTQESIPKSGRLSIVARFGVGYDSVDVTACTSNDIAVCITPDGVRRPVAASILTLILALSSKLIIKDKITRLGKVGFVYRNDHMGMGLEGRTLGSIGLGNIGSEMFKLTKPLGMNFIAHDPYAEISLASELGVELVNLESIFTQSDVITINCPLNSQTHHLVNSDRIAKMKSHAYLINTSRGPIVDQKALTKALINGKIAGAGLDVFEEEPPDENDPILKLENVILTPHALCWTDQCFKGIGAANVTSVLDIYKGMIPGGLVNKKLVQSDSFRKKLENYQSKNLGKS